jgi:hypothetical protein
LAARKAQVQLAVVAAPNAIARWPLRCIFTGTAWHCLSVSSVTSDDSGSTRVTWPITPARR